MSRVHLKRCGSCDPWHLKSDHTHAHTPIHTTYTLFNYEGRQAEIQNSNILTTQFLLYIKNRKYSPRCVFFFLPSVTLLIRNGHPSEGGESKWKVIVKFQNVSRLPNQRLKR